MPEYLVMHLLAIGLGAGLWLEHRRHAPAPPVPGAADQESGREAADDPHHDRTQS